MASEKGKCTLDLNTPGEVKRKRGRPLKSQATRNLVLSPGSAGASLSVMGAVSSPPAMSAVSSMPMRVAVASPNHSQHSTCLPQLKILSGAQVGEAVIVYAPSGFYAPDFTAHVIHVDCGEDVIRKIMSLVQNGPRGICVVSAYGTVSSALISHPISSGGSVTMSYLV
ncbi:AT-hook motif nuclear-localized protein 3-like [Apium graveolens]|uniref:AT-hook motif nuclear-localized protein 3-like n=1 Tax=Apium graveolens TaxID=4045 RepID=UPI003D7BECF3